MHSHKLISHVRAAACLTFALTFATTAIPQENQPLKLLKKVIPAYPEILKKMNVSGTVRVQVTVAADGSVKDVQTLGGNAILVESVASAVRDWKYAPSDRASRTSEITVTFICCSTVYTKP